MRRMRVAMLGVVGLMAGAMWAGAGRQARGDGEDPPALPTEQEVQDLVDGGKFMEGLKKVSRLAALNGKGAEGFDRQHIFMMRAECLLQTHQNPSALDALGSAKKESKKVAEFAEAGALEALIKTSAAGVYTPKNTAKDPAVAKTYSVLDRGQRKAAYGALYAETVLPLAEVAKNIKIAKNLPDLVRFGKSLETARVLEIAATGADGQTGAFLKDATTQAADLMAQAVKSMNKQVTFVETYANQALPYQATVADPLNAGRTIQQLQYRKQGLDPQSKTRLNDVIATCDKMAPAAKELVGALGVADEPFKAVILEAADLKTHATMVLQADYTQAATAH